MPVNETVHFKPGEDKSPLTVVILDDDEKPTLENEEYFYILLSDPVESTITMPEKVKVIIDDTQQDEDAPSDGRLPAGQCDCDPLDGDFHMTIPIHFPVPEVSFEDDLYEVPETIGSFEILVLRKGVLDKPTTVKVQSFSSKNPKNATG